MWVLIVKVKNFSILFFFISSLLINKTTKAGILTLEVKKKNTYLYKNSSKKSEKIRKLKKGYILNSSERKGRYWIINKEDCQGEGSKNEATSNCFVYYKNVKKSKSVQNSSVANALAKIIQNKKAEAEDPVNTRGRSQVMGVRGLEENDVSFIGNIRPNLRLVYSMETRKISENKMEKLESLIYKEIDALEKKLAKKRKKKKQRQQTTN